MASQFSAGHDYHRIFNFEYHKQIIMQRWPGEKKSIMPLLNYNVRPLSDFDMCLGSRQQVICILLSSIESKKNSETFTGELSVPALSVRMTREMRRQTWLDGKYLPLNF
jgi:hypothetical protein